MTGVDFGKAQRCADEILHETRLNRERAPDAVLVARRFGVRVKKVARHALRLTPASAVHLESGWLIAVREDTAVATAQFCIAHEVLHVACRRWKIVPEDWEGFANAGAAALLVPSGCLQEKWHQHRNVRKTFAAWPHCPPTATTLRLGECGIAPTWITQGDEVRYRRAESSPPEVTSIGSEAARRGQATRPGLRATRLPDAPRRAAVVGEASVA